MNFENITVSEQKAVTNTTYYINPFIWNTERKQISENKDLWLPRVGFGVGSGCWKVRGFFLSGVMETAYKWFWGWLHYILKPQKGSL